MRAPGIAGEEELATYRAMRPGVHQGYAATFDQLEAYLRAECGQATYMSSRATRRRQRLACAASRHGTPPAHEGAIR